MLISIVIVNFNGEKFIKTCLESIFSEKNNQYEVIVVDNHSKDKSLKIINDNFFRHKNFRVMSLKKNIGAPAARNFGVKKSKGKYLLFLDYDTAIKKDWFKSIKLFFETNKQVGAAYGKILKKGTKKFDSAGEYLSPLGFLIERSRGITDRGQFDKVVPIFSGKGAALLVRKNVFKKINGFDDDYFYLWEEPDLTWRVWLSGYQVVYLPSFVVFHEYVTTEKNFNYYNTAQVTYRGCRNAILTLIKNLGNFNLFIILPLHIVSWLVLSILLLLKLEFKKSFDILRGILWNIINFKVNLKKRSVIQKNRKITDQKLFNIVIKKKKLAYYAGKAISYTFGKPF